MKERVPGQTKNQSMTGFLKFLGFAVIFTKYVFHWVLNPPKINPLIRVFFGGQPLLTNSFGMQVLRHEQPVPAPEPRCYDERDAAASRETQAHTISGAKLQ